MGNQLHGFAANGSIESYDCFRRIIMHLLKNKNTGVSASTVISKKKSCDRYYKYPVAVLLGEQSSCPSQKKTLPLKSPSSSTLNHSAFLNNKSAYWGASHTKQIIIPN